MMGLGEQLENVINEAISTAVEEAVNDLDLSESIEKALGDYDFSDVMKDVFKDEIDVDGDIEKAMNDFDFSDAIHDSVKDYDWWEEIEYKVKDEIETEVDNKVSDAVSTLLASDEFKAAVRCMLVLIGKETLAESQAKIKEWVTYPFRKIRGWYQRIKDKVS